MIIANRVSILLMGQVSGASGGFPVRPRRLLMFHFRAKSRIVAHAGMGFGVSFECAAALARSFEKTTKQLFEGAPLESHDPAIIDQWRSAQGVDFGAKIRSINQGSRGGTVVELRNALDGEIEFIPEQPAHRRIRTGIERFVE